MDQLAGLTLGPAVAAPAMVREADERIPSELPCIRGPDGERYYAGGILGRGSYGVVLRYESTRGGRPLAVKVIHGRESREQEDRACEVPACRGVVPQIKLCPSDRWAGAAAAAGAAASTAAAEPRWSPRQPTSWAFYAMPCLADMSTLEAVSGRRAGERAARVVGAMARALARLSRLGFRYHDLKPNNLLIDGQGGMFLGDLASVATRASTYPPPMCLSRQFRWYRHEGGFVRGPRAECYALNTVWALIVSFLIVAMPGRSVKVGGRERSVSRIFAFSCPAVADRDHGEWALDSAAHLLELVGRHSDAATVLGVVLDRARGGHLPQLGDTLRTVGQLG